MVKHHRRAEGGKVETSDKEWDGRVGDDELDEPTREVYAGAGSHVNREADGSMVNEEAGMKAKRGGRAKKRGGRVHKAVGGAEGETEGGAERGKHHPEERSRGGETKKRHERMAKKHGGHVEHMDGKAAKHRLDRARRKTGGGVGSDSNPLTSASRIKDRVGGEEDGRSRGGD